MTCKRMFRFIPLFVLVQLSLGASLEAMAQSQINCLTQNYVLFEECSAIVSVYNTTNGAGWNNKTGWLTDTDPCTWSGVACEESIYCTPTYPPVCSNVNRITHLALGGKNLVGSIPTTIGILAKLKVLSLGSNQLSGSIPDEIWTLVNLTNLDLSSNQLNGSIPPAIGSLSNLLTLKLDHNQLEGIIPSAVGQLTKLTMLSLSSNQFSGIAFSFGTLPGLQYLFLNNNLLDGNLPSISVLDNLLQLDFSNNLFAGTLGSFFGSGQRDLSIVRLNNNQLSGPVPESLRYLSDLNILDLHDNQLNGSIPASLGSLRQVGTIDLHGNQLSGYLPSELGNIPYLGALYLQNNQLDGVVPLSVAQTGAPIDCDFTATSLCIPDTSEYQAIGVDPICGLALSGSCGPVCGDSLINAPEECDDGNITDRDGCSASCSVETGWQCSGEVSVCRKLFFWPLMVPALTY